MQSLCQRGRLWLDSLQSVSSHPSESYSEACRGLCRAPAVECRAWHVYGLLGDVGMGAAMALSPLKLGMSPGEDFEFVQTCEVASRGRDVHVVQHRTLGS